MDDLGHGSALEFIQAFPNRAQTLPFKVADDHIGDVQLPGWHFLSGQRGELPEFVRCHGFECQLDPTHGFIVKV